MKKFSILFFLLTFLILSSTALAATYVQPNYKYSDIIKAHGQPTLYNESQFSKKYTVLLHDYSNGGDTYRILISNKPFHVERTNFNYFVLNSTATDGYYESYKINMKANSPVWETLVAGDRTSYIAYKISNYSNDTSVNYEIIYSSSTVSVYQDQKNELETDDEFYQAGYEIPTPSDELPPVEDEGATGFPPPPTAEYAFTYPIVYVDHNGDTALALFSSDERIEFEATRDVNKILINFTTASASKLSMYVLENDDWDSRGHNVFSEPDTRTATLNIGYIVSCPFAIYNSDGTIFFLQPLEHLGATIMGAMWATTIAAVSCLALLISLVILSRVLRTYLA